MQTSGGYFVTAWNPPDGFVVQQSWRLIEFCRITESINQFGLSLEYMRKYRGGFFEGRFCGRKEVFSVSGGLRRGLGDDSVTVSSGVC